MISLTYFSTAVATFDDDELDELLAHSRARNHDRGLTGLLLYADGHFVQTLEGEETQVQHTYDLIAADPRHRDVFTTLRDQIETRSFPDWSMGFDRLTSEQAHDVPGFSTYLRADATTPAATGRSGVFHRVFRDRMRRVSYRELGSSHQGQGA
ncbi:BLUF domain-containing protein [Nocardioides aequoreus]|uniref:BLUF domain-containing protein n=1 Tax=Nocardioides aequoreus TaxID=397278 RepID=UPI000691E18F|nr:BLUF domain-containing protein [Nocardioides aequoreus]